MTGGSQREQHHEGGGRVVVGDDLLVLGPWCVGYARSRALVDLLLHNTHGLQGTHSFGTAQIATLWGAHRTIRGWRDMSTIAS